MSRFDAMMAAAQEQNGLSDWEELMARQVGRRACECCGDTGIEQLDIGHGAISEVPCSLCAANTQAPAKSEAEVAAQVGQPFRDEQPSSLPTGDA